MRGTLNRKRCPELRRGCCGKPSMCGLTGAEVDKEACARCEHPPALTSPPSPGPSAG